MSGELNIVGGLPGGLPVRTPIPAQPCPGCGKLVTYSYQTVDDPNAENGLFWVGLPDRPPIIVCKDCFYLGLMEFAKLVRKAREEVK